MQCQHGRRQHAEQRREHLTRTPAARTHLQRRGRVSVRLRLKLFGVACARGCPVGKCARRCVVVLTMTGTCMALTLCERSRCNGGGETPQPMIVMPISIVYTSPGMDSCRGATEEQTRSKRGANLWAAEQTQRESR